MVSLTIYIISFVVVIGIVGSITVFFSNNARDVNMSSGASSEYNKFNLYILKQIKDGYKISKISDSDSDKNGQYITFSDGQHLNTFVKSEDLLYFNKIKLCENVDEFKVDTETANNGKQVLKTYLKINGIVYTTDYVVE